MSNTQSIFRLDTLQDGETLSCEVDGTEVLLCKVAGQYYAVSNRCSHANQVLSEGKLRGFQISCPLHGARFDVRDGKCLAAPATQSIDTFPIVIKDDEIVIITTTTTTNNECH